jgi:hypothetical protein
MDLADVYRIFHPAIAHYKYSEKPMELSLK